MPNGCRDPPVITDMIVRQRGTRAGHIALPTRLRAPYAPGQATLEGTALPGAGP